ncbi:LiaI-LiaF-like domain-containing protein [Serpentinicella alkaliphila]|uniref:LiaI-LiaF-like transmembrane region domain-containing protein n=1 Tax=Serpentinicella alkaliphila TaxID=1734049 RepID=A0A4V2T2Q2_9FIRM|nr:DUF5668 domain-containing protein [Serpentinicella alkaliphila]QUH24404.1 hypothetical protein HZR23_00390 [Serpentinicella alkaliphila]TCP98363.1 hypothetical protein EDD79_104319 [Serpentinicella alkaliphila]
MDKNKWMSGLFLITLGLVFLLANLGIISWSFIFNIVTLWPLLLIIVGINIMFKKNYVIRIFTWIIFIAALIGYSVFTGNYKYMHHSYDSSYTQGNAVLMDESIESAYLELKLGGTDLGIVGGTSEALVDIKANDTIYHSVETNNNNRHANINIENSSEEFFNRNRINQKINLSLNTEIPWKIHAKVGAIAGNLDFRDILIEELKIQVGAGDLDIRFGALASNTTAEINAGASNLKLYIPSSTGVKINSTSVLSSTNLKDLGWTRLGREYISPNYEETENKLYVDLKMGVGNMNVFFGE